MAREEKETKVEVGEFNNHPVLKIFEIRDDGAKRDTPALSFGKAKARLIIKHIEDIEAFVEGNLT